MRNEALGDCYQAAFEYMMDRCLYEEANYILVHAEVAGRGPLEGLTFGHAFLLNDELVIDPSNGRIVEMPRQLYYFLGCIDQINNLHNYSWKDAKKKVLQFKHYGPWDLVTSTDL
jgi:hypothetical protein